MAAGMAVAGSLTVDKVSVLAVDALGRVVVIRPTDYKILSIPRVSDNDLDQLTEDESIAVMVKEGREELEMLSYLGRRANR
jgi:hypothetical protein